jgi:hypothetical protein
MIHQTPGWGKTEETTMTKTQCNACGELVPADQIADPSAHNTGGDTVCVRCHLECLGLPAVTIRLDAAYDLRAAGLPEIEADDLAAVYREAAAAICDGVAEVTVERVTGGADVGCNQEWSQEYGLWQAAHDCCRRENDQWHLDAAAVERHRGGLRRWMARKGITDPVA